MNWNELIGIEEYIERIEQIQSKKNSTTNYAEAYRPYLDANTSRILELLPEIQIQKKLYNLLSTLKTPTYWVLITEPWCGDASHTTPLIYQLAQSNSNITCNIALRDTHTEWIQAYSTAGKQSIPILVIHDTDKNVLFRWGPRPNLCSKYIEQLDVSLPRDEKMRHVHDWYYKDKGEETQKELYDLFKKHT